MIVDGKVDELTEILRAEITTAPLGESIAAAQDLIREAQNELNALPSSSHVDSLNQLGDGLRDLLDQLRE